MNQKSESELQRIADKEMDDIHGHNSTGCYGQGVYLDDIPHKKSPCDTCEAVVPDGVWKCEGCEYYERG